MIDIDNVTFWYADGVAPTLNNVNLHIEEGELVLLAGRTGVGKSTLLGTLNGLVPHFTGGHLEGTVRIDGISTASRPPRDFSHLVGMVQQDPLAGFVTDTVEEELAYGMEQLGLSTQVMRRRVEETLDLLGIADLRDRALRTLSGGQQQRVAIGAVLTMHPAVLILDEPTSALDPTAAEEVLATLSRLVHDLGTTVIVAEHRMERVVPFADRMVLIHADGSVEDGYPADILRTSPVAPPVVRLGRFAAWDPLPLSVREARRRAGPLREQLAQLPSPARVLPVTRAAVLTARKIVVKYGAKVAVNGADLDLYSGQVVAIMGRNGSGKSSLLWALQGSGQRDGGSVQVDGTDPKAMSRAAARKTVGMVPQTASDLLDLETVAQECAAADRDSGAGSGVCSRLLDRLAPGIERAKHPRDLSEGQKLALVLAIQLSAAPSIMLLDEPTRGLDYTAKAAFADIIAAMAAEDRCVVVASHDVEFVAAVADRVLVMAQGDIVADGPVADVLGGSPAFAPQVAKILGPDWLTVTEVATAVGASR